MSATTAFLQLSAKRHRENDLWRFRVLDAIIPDFDGIVAVEQENLPTPASPILPRHMRPALLAGIAIVERAGPEMLRILRRHMMGQATSLDLQKSALSIISPTYGQGPEPP